MPIATRIPRYNKSQKLFIDEHEITLIDHLKQLRTERKITKKKISNIIKQNDTWYSQIERNGKNGDDNRQKTIYRPDLVNIISIVKYGANSISELGEFNKQSEIYIDKIMKAVPIQESLKNLEWYQINNNRTPNEQERLFESLIDSIGKSIKRAYTNLSNGDKDVFLNCLKEINASLKIDVCFLITLAGLPFSEFLYEADQNKIDHLFKDVLGILDQIETNNNDSKSISNNTHYSHIIREKIEKYIGISKITRRNNFEFLNDEDITW